MDDTPDDQLPGDIESLRLDELEERLSCLAGRIAAAECEFLLLLAEFDARQGWGASGMKSSAHWLSWRTGMRLGVAREKVRVARSLSRLPLVRQAFAAGRLSYCKVRALSRVATPPVEADLVELALGATGAQLERIVRAWRTTLLGEAAMSSHLRRGLSRRDEVDGSVVYTLRVAPEESAVVDAALEAARPVVLDDAGRPVETPEEAALAEAATGAAPPQRAEADAFVLIAESFLASGAAPTPGDHTQVVIHADLEALVAAVQQAERAAAVSSAADGTADRAAPASTGTSIEQRSFAARPPGCRVDSGEPISASTVLRLMCSSPLQLMLHAKDGRPLDLGRSRRHASRRQRRALWARDGCCRFPGCSQRRRLVPHHVRWWTRQGRTDMDNLVLLCPTHHRAVHELGYLVVALGRGRFAFHRPDGARLPDSGALNTDEDGELTRAPVTVRTITPTWGGEHIDLGLVIGGLSDNLLNQTGRKADIADRELDATLRRAARWPPGHRAA